MECSGRGLSCATGLGTVLFEWPRSLSSSEPLRLTSESELKLEMVLVRKASASSFKSPIFSIAGYTTMLDFVITFVFSSSGTVSCILRSLGVRFQRNLQVDG